jgi:excisionase family DNA binding protein
MLLKLSEVSQRLNCSLSNVYALVDSGKLPVIRTGGFGKGYRVSEDDLRTFIDSCRKQETRPWPATTKPIQKLRNIRLSKP